MTLDRPSDLLTKLACRGQDPVARALRRGIRGAAHLRPSFRSVRALPRQPFAVLMRSTVRWLASPGICVPGVAAVFWDAPGSTLGHWNAALGCSAEVRKIQPSNDFRTT